MQEELFSHPSVVQEAFARFGYILSPDAATCLFVAGSLEKPILIEGPAGVGKTELAKTMALCLKRPLIRLQCYEGLDETKALYEWKYGKQLLYVQMLKDKIAEIMSGAESLSLALARLREQEDAFFSRDFLEPRPLLRALLAPEGAVLLVDEVDKSDPEFEALLLEVLSDFQVTIPEIGTVQALQTPFVVLTSNRVRELGEALRRRCLYLHMAFPDKDLERRIVQARVPALAKSLNAELVSFVQAMRALDLKKHPSVAETIDWARTLVLLHADRLDVDLVRTTLHVLVKFEEDAAILAKESERLVKEAMDDGQNPSFLR